MRWLGLIVMLWLGGCGAAKAPVDAGVDLSAGHCDPQQVFAACSAQCHEPVCIVAAATCAGDQWICDCSLTGPCRSFDLSASD